MSGGGHPPQCGDRGAPVQAGEGRGPVDQASDWATHHRQPCDRHPSRNPSQPPAAPSSPPAKRQAAEMGAGPGLDGTDPALPEPSPADANRLYVNCLRIMRNPML